MARADKFVMKTGETYIGHYERDGVIMGSFDGVRRTLFRATRVATREEGEGLGAWESFKLIQPKKNNFVANQMPTILSTVAAGPWDELGRRTLKYTLPRGSGKTYDTTQALIELGPKACKLRGIETYWAGQVYTSTVPRSVIEGLISRIPKEEKDERLRAVRFYLQAGFYDEAARAVDALRRDFPDMAEMLDGAARSIVDEQIAAALAKLKTQLDAGWPVGPIKTESQNLLSQSDKASGATKATATEFLDQINATIDSRSRRQRELKAAFDGARGDSTTSGPGPQYLAEMLEALEKCPSRDEPIFAPFDLYARNPDGVDPKKAWALALSAWCIGPEKATGSIAAALAYADAYEAISKGFNTESDAERDSMATRLGGILLEDTEKDRPLKPAEAAAIALRVRPVNTLSDDTGTKPVIYRVGNDPNAARTEYHVIVPPGYHHLGQWPAVVVLNPGGKPAAALDQWKSEAAQRGFILIAPDLESTGAYHFSSDEHATVTLALRDALKRLAIDPNRVFVAGSLGGGDMAWDYATAHPDMLAGGVILSGLPAKFVPAYKQNSQMVPLYIAEGELTPGEAQFIQPLARSLMQKNFDVTYVQYYKRGYEFLAEEIPTAFEWMKGRSRNPAPAEISAVAAREGDQRFFGLVIQEFTSGRSLSAEAVDPLGENLKPATVETRFLDKTNQIQITCDGVRALDVWVNAAQFDFTKRLDVKLGGRSRFRGTPEVQWDEFLKDLAIRGDRAQTYFMKIEIR
jgi:pimeloyl-ACP methyl ester carboxylesterase